MQPNMDAGWDGRTLTCEAMPADLSATASVASPSPMGMRKLLTHTSASRRLQSTEV